MSTDSDTELNPLLFGGAGKLVNIKCFTGDGPFTEAELRSELASALSQRGGAMAISNTFGDDAPKIDVGKLMASLQA